MENELPLKAFGRKPLTQSQFTIWLMDSILAPTLINMSTILMGEETSK